jgi:sugar (pentulose or hexulose) kinase
VQASGAVIGGLPAALTAEIGLRAGTPVCNATGDNQASVLGSVADIEHSVLLNVGTGGQISWAIPEFRRVVGMDTRPLPPDRCMLVGASLCGGRAYAWLNDSLRAWTCALGLPEPSREAVYERLNALAAEAAPDCGRLKMDTRLAGTRTEPHCRGALLGLSLENGTLGNLARAALAGMVAELHAYAQAANHCGYKAVVASGNAVRRNPLLRQIIRECVGKPVLIPAHLEEAAYGAALLAGTQAGFWPDLTTAARCIRHLP